MTIREPETFERDKVLPLYAEAGWINYTRDPDRLAEAYRHSYVTLGAYEGDVLIGVLRAVGDGVSAVLVQDLIVAVAYRRGGVGTALVQALLARCEHVYQILLLTDDTPGTTAFYSSLGLKKAETMGCCAFVRVRLWT